MLKLCEREEGDIMNKKENRPICPVCGSRDIIARLKTKTFWCRRCMHVGERKEFFKDEHKNSKD